MSSTEPRKVSLDEAAPAIKRSLAARRGPALFDKALAKWRTSASPKLAPEAFDHLSVDEDDGMSVSVKIAEGHGEEAVVTLGDTTIDLATAAAALSRLPAVDQRAIISGGKRDRFMDQLVDLAVLSEASKELGVADHPLVQQRARRKAVDVLREQVVAETHDAAVTDEQIRARYEAERDKYRRPERRRAVHIAFVDKKKAVQLRNKLLAMEPRPSPARAELVKKWRMDPEWAAPGGGTLPYVAKDDNPPGVEVPEPLLTAAFELERYEPSMPIQVDNMWHILVVDGVREPVDIPFEKVERPIRMALAREPAEAAMNALKTKLRASTTVQLFPDELEHVKTPELRGEHHH